MVGELWQSIRGSWPVKRQPESTNQSCDQTTSLASWWITSDQTLRDRAPPNTWGTHPTTHSGNESHRVRRDHIPNFTTISAYSASVPTVSGIWRENLRKIPG